MGKYLQIFCLTIIFKIIFIESLCSSEFDAEKSYLNNIIQYESIQPSNPNATKEAKCILNYLYNLSKNSQGKIISGQYTNVALNIDSTYKKDIIGLYNTTNKWVGIIGVDYQRVAGGLPQRMHETNQRVIEYFKNGGLVTMFCSFSNPWTNKGFNDTTGRYQIMDLIDSTKPVHKEWLKRLDSVAYGLKELQDSGVVVLYRFFSENNGFWFWWGSQTPELPTQENWIKLWKFTHNYFTNVKKLNNILWVFAPSAKETANKNPYFKPDLHYYPGNEFVDIVGTSVYNDTLDSSYYNDIKATGKPIALTEFGPGNISRMSKNYDYTTLINQIKSKYPDFVYWVSWNDFVTNGGKDTVYYSPMNQRNGKNLFEDAWVVNRDEINWLDNCINDTENITLLEPEDGKVYHGVQTMTFADTPDPLEGYLSAINDSTIQPAVRGFFFSIPGERGPANTLRGLGNFFKIADSVGFIPELSLFFVDNRSATDSIIAVSNTHDWILDSIITLCKNYSRKMFLRIGGEFNGAGEGWNGGGYHPYIYVTMFRKIVNMFDARGFRDSIAVNWCYEPDAANDFDSVDAKGARWYPGDEYVDWFGLDVFQPAHFDQSLPDGTGRNITKKGKSERFLAMAREKEKPVFLSETSAQGINISSDNQDGINDWNNWFAKFFEFIDVHKEIKGYCYIDANWPENAYPEWGDARIENSSYVTQKYIEEMRKPKYIHLYNEFIEQPVDTFPLTEMGETKWKGFDGGLYPDGKNIRPNEHNSDGIEMANSILPLNDSGNPDDNGKIILLSIGMSNCTQEFSAFKMIADTFQMKNPKLLIVDGAQGGQTASVIKDPNANFWTVVGQRLQQQNVTTNQVQVLWLKEANAQPNEAFPIHAQILKDDLKTVVQILKDKYPNLKIAYLSSRTYGGYATTTLNPEPYAYESGFSVKWLIEEQINGDDSLIFSGESSKAPWLSWGPYLWAKGTTPREDGFFWLLEDFGNDGTHPSNSGRLKVANLLLEFFRNDETSKPWFLATDVSVEENILQDNIIRIYPNPTADYICITGIEGDVEILNVLGIRIFKEAIISGQKLDISALDDGIYFLKINNKFQKFMVLKCVK